MVSMGTLTYPSVQILRKQKFAPSTKSVLRYLITIVGGGFSCWISTEYSFFQLQLRLGLTLAKLRSPTQPSRENQYFPDAGFNKVDGFAPYLNLWMVCFKDFVKWNHLLHEKQHIMIKLKNVWPFERLWNYLLFLSANFFSHIIICFYSSEYKSDDISHYQNEILQRKCNLLCLSVQENIL